MSKTLSWTIEEAPMKNVGKNRALLKGIFAWKEKRLN
jgi:hypothetical protein